jgi:hypothetical protein
MHFFSLPLLLASANILFLYYLSSSQLLPFKEVKIFFLHQALVVAIFLPHL